VAAVPLQWSAALLSHAPLVDTPNPHSTAEVANASGAVHDPDEPLHTSATSQPLTAGRHVVSLPL
jgi:hypothetical protein